MNIMPAKQLPPKDGTASWVSDWIDTQKWHLLSVNLAWGAVAATSGTLSLEGTNDPTQVNDTAFSPSAAVVTLTISTFHGTWPTVGAVAANALVNISECPAFVRVKYTRIAGGGAAQFSTWVMGRAT